MSSDSKATKLNKTKVKLSEGIKEGTTIIVQGSEKTIKHHYDVTEATAYAEHLNQLLHGNCMCTGNN
jgi:hypothetical protein